MEEVLSMKDLYIDIDGVILGHDRVNNIVIAAPLVKEFLFFAIDNFNCFWLSSHTKNGKIEHLLLYLGKYFDNDVLLLVSKIKPAEYRIYKTEAINFDMVFYWLDDRPTVYELEVLKLHNSLDQWINVDARKDPYSLADVTKFLQYNT